MSYADARVTKLVMANLLGNPKKWESKKRVELVQRMEVAYPDFPVKDINDMIIVVKQQNEVDKKRKVEAKLQSNDHTMIWSDVLNSIIKIIKGYNETFLSNNSSYFMCLCLFLSLPSLSSPFLRHIISNFLFLCDILLLLFLYSTGKKNEREINKQQQENNTNKNMREETEMKKTSWEGSKRKDSMIITYPVRCHHPRWRYPMWSACGGSWTGFSHQRNHPWTSFGTLRGK